MIMNQKGFTLVEMMIVLAVITTLLIISIPNLANNNSMIKAKGCEAYVQLVEAQVEAYRMANDGSTMPTIADLVNGGYIKGATCPDGKTLTIGSDGQVTVSP